MPSQTYEYPNHETSGYVHVVVHNHTFSPLDALLTGSALELHAGEATDLALTRTDEAHSTLTIET